MTQAHALAILKTGKNVFITGPAGSGKTHVVNEYIHYLKDHGVSVGITASTGIAATHMGGMTIHSWTGMGIKDHLTDHDLAALAEKPQTARRIREAAVLIIDEVSMLHHFRLDTVDAVTRAVRKSSEPFGGLQVVLCGDFFQLPPVSRYGEPDTHFIYRSEAWRDGKFTVCYLHENYRQMTDVSLSILNEIRAGEVSDDSREHLRTRSGHHVRTTSIEPTRLYTHNVDVDTVNESELDKVTGYEVTYEMTSKGKKPLVDALKKSCLAPERLRLKKGARVMCVKNNFEKGYVNGTLGVVISCGHGVDPIIRTAPNPDYPDGRLVTIEQADWNVEDDGKVLAQITQYPLRLAWAITVHKSQGMSLDAIEVDLSRAFTPGMGYVALSRVRTLAGLTIIGMNENALVVHPEVLEYDRTLRDLSDKAESVIEYADVAEVKRAQEEFLAKVAPMHAIRGGVGSKEKGGRQNKKKVSTIEQTKMLVKEKLSLVEMAKARVLAAQTIVDHLETLVELGPENGGVALAEISYLKRDISPIHFLKIEKALEEVSQKQEGEAAGTLEKPPLLSPVKSKVGPNISFRDIQLVRVLLGYIRRK